MFKNSGFHIKDKLFLIVFNMALFILAAVNYYYYTYTSETMLKNKYDHLLTVRRLKHNMILDYFSHLKSDLKDSSAMLINTLNKYDKPLELVKTLSLDVTEDEDIDIEKYNILFPNITGESNLLSDFLGEVADSSGFILDHIGAANFYIINDKGDIVFNLYKLPDGFRNIYEEDFSDEGILKCIEKLETTPGNGDVAITDLSDYKFFQASPVFFSGFKFKTGEEVGYIVSMHTANEINKIMTIWMGLGKSGETYLVGSDYLMRNDSRFIVEEPDRLFRLLKKTGVAKEKIKKMKEKKSTILILEVMTEGSEDALKGNKGTGIIKDYREIEVLSSYGLIQIEDFKWAILSEIDAEEAFKDIYDLRSNMIKFSLLIILILLIFTALLVEKITKRIMLLKEGAEMVSGGNYDINIFADGTDEIADLSRAFNKMSVELKEKEDELKSKNIELEEKVINRTKELNAQKEFSDKIVSTAASFIVGVSSTGNIELANDAFLRITACDKKELLGSNFLDFISNDEKSSEFKGFLKSSVAEKGHFDCELTTRKFEKKVISWDAVELHIEDGDDLMICIGQDITDRIALENSLRKKTAEVESFVYTVSHDLKNPTISLMGMLDLFMQDCGDDISEKGAFYLERFKANSKMINELLSGLLEVSKLGRMDDTEEDVDISELINYIIQENQYYIEKFGVIVDVDKTLPAAYFSRLRLYQVFSNLFKNALKFSCEDVTPEIKIGCNVTDDENIYYIWDNGIGIDEEYYSKVFEMFSRLSEKEVEGTGIGLTIVKKIIENSGGRIWIKSKKGEGTTFYIAISKKRAYPVEDETCCIDPNCGVNGSEGASGASDGGDKPAK